MPARRVAGGLTFWTFLACLARKMNAHQLAYTGLSRVRTYDLPARKSKPFIELLQIPINTLVEYVLRVLRFLVPKTRGFMGVSATGAFHSLRCQRIANTVPTFPKQAI